MNASVQRISWNAAAGRLSLGLLAVALWLAAEGRTMAAGQFDDPDTAVEAGREALRDSQNYPWYDADTDAVERIDIDVPKQPVNSSPSWNLSGMADVFRILGWTVLAVMLAAIVYLLIRTFLSRETAAAANVAVDSDLAARSDIDRVEALPFRLQRPQSDLLGEAERHYRAGNYDEAIIYLYSHQLVELDRHQAIRLARGKTNRQFLREAQARTSVADLLEATMVIFEDAFFGGHPITRARFESVYHRTEEFHDLLAQTLA